MPKDAVGGVRGGGGQGMLVSVGNPGAQRPSSGGVAPTGIEWRDLPSEILFLLLRHAGARAAGGWARACKSTYSTVQLIRDHLFLSFLRDQPFQGVLCRASQHDNLQLRAAKRYLSLLEEPDAARGFSAELAARATLPWCGAASQLSLDILFLVQVAPHACFSDTQGCPSVDQDTQQNRADERWGEELHADEKVRVLEVATVEQAFRCCLELAIHSELCTVTSASRRGGRIQGLVEFRVSGLHLASCSKPPVCFSSSLLPVLSSAM